MASPNNAYDGELNIRVDSSSLADALDIVSLDSPAVPVKVVFDSDGMSVWTHDSARTVQVCMDGVPLKDYKADEPCSVVVNPDTMSTLLKAKFSSTVELKNDSSQVSIRDKDGSRVSYYAADEDECNTIPDHWRLGTDEGWLTFPMLDNQRATTRVLVSLDELRQGLVDMKVSGAPYVVFTFNPGDSPSFCRSGHWGAKSTDSLTIVQADVEGEQAEVCFTTALASVLSRFPSSGKVMLQKHKDAPFFVMHTLPGSDGNIQVVATEAVREA